MKRILIAILLLGAVGGGWYARDRFTVRQDAAPAFHGNVDIREVRLAFRVGGRVAQVLKEEGDPVAAGDVVARLDAVPYENAVNQAEAQVGQLAARLEELENGSRPEEIERARRNVAEASGGWWTTAPWGGRISTRPAPPSRRPGRATAQPGRPWNCSRPGPAPNRSPRPGRPWRRPAPPWPKPGCSWPTRN
jgi:hypothetical protein